MNIKLPESKGLGDEGAYSDDDESVGVCDSGCSFTETSSVPIGESVSETETVDEPPRPESNIDGVLCSGMYIIRLMLLK